ncbi:hypothetical protein T484DRAFT_1796201, partial [Baffinella frigidus]
AREKANERWRGVELEITVGKRLFGGFAGDDSVEGGGGKGFAGVGVEKLVQFLLAGAKGKPGAGEGEALEALADAVRANGVRAGALKDAGGCAALAVCLKGPPRAAGRRAHKILTVGPSGAAGRRAHKILTVDLACGALRPLQSDFGVLGLVEEAVPLLDEWGETAGDNSVASAAALAEAVPLLDEWGETAGDNSVASAAALAVLLQVYAKATRGTRNACCCLAGCGGLWRLRRGRMASRSCKGLLLWCV